MMSKVKLTPFAVVILVCLLCVPMVSAQTSFSCADVTEIPTIECEALVALYHSTGGDNWQDTGSMYYEQYNVGLDVREGWLQTNTPCSWHGVNCSSGNVNELDKSWSALSGSVPAEVGNLINLTELDLSDNQLTAIPAEIEKLINLTTLELYFNQLTTLPSEIGKLTTLTTLGISENPLTTLPDEIWNLTNLTEFGLVNSQITMIPAEIGNLTNVTRLYLYNNPLTTIPAEIGNLTNLTLLRVSGNELTTIPAEIGNLTNLTTLLLQDNQLTILPAEMLNLTALNTFNADPDVCVTANSANFEAWRNVTGITTLLPCDATSVTTHTIKNQTTAPMSAIYFILFLIGGYATIAIWKELGDYPFMLILQREITPVDLVEPCAVCDENVQKRHGVFESICNAYASRNHVQGSRASCDDATPSKSASDNLPYPIVVYLLQNRFQSATAFPQSWQR